MYFKKNVEFDGTKIPISKTYTALGYFAQLFGATPRMPVTTRIGVSLVGDLYKPSWLPLSLGKGASECEIM